MNYDEALEKLVQLGFVPNWNAAQARVQFEKAPGLKPGYGWTRQLEEEARQQLVHVLRVSDERSIRRVRTTVIDRLRAQNRLRPKRIVFRTHR